MSVSLAENGAEREENRVQRSGAWSGPGREMMERSGARSGGYRNKLELGAAFSPLTLRSHALGASTPQR